MEDNKSTSCCGFTRRRARLGMREFLYREALYQGSLKEDRVLEVDSAFERQGWRGRSGSLIIEVERRVQELMCWEIRILQICV